MSWFDSLFGGADASAVDVGSSFDSSQMSVPEGGQSFADLLASSGGVADNTPTSSVDTSQMSVGDGGGSFADLYAGGSYSGVSSLDDAYASAQGYLQNALGKIGEAWDAIFVEPTQTQETYTRTGEKVTSTTGGGISDIGKMLIAGAVQGLGQSQIAKWQADTAAKEAQKSRDFAKAQQDEAYRRKAFSTTGKTPGAPARGAGLLASRR